MTKKELPPLKKMETQGFSPSHRNATGSGYFRGAGGAEATPKSVGCTLLCISRKRNSALCQTAFHLVKDDVVDELPEK